MSRSTHAGGDQGIAPFCPEKHDNADASRQPLDRHATVRLSHSRHTGKQAFRGPGATFESYAGFSLSTAHCVSWKGSRNDTYRRKWTRRRDGCRRPFMSRQSQLECGLQPGDRALSLARNSNGGGRNPKCPWDAVKWFSVEAGLLGGT